MGDRKFAVLGAGLATVALTLAGCGGGGDDDPTPTPTITSGTVTTTEATTPEATADATTPEPSPSDPWALGPPAVTLPMQHDNEEGAVAFVEYYIELTNYSYAELDTSELEKWADVDCVACNDTISSVAALTETGFSVRGGETSVDSSRNVTYYPEADVYIVESNFTSVAAEVLNSDGEVVRTEPGTTGAVGFTVDFNGPYDWTMISFGAIE